MVDVAIQAMSDWAAGGDNANCGGPFAAAEASDALLERTRRTLGQLLGADPLGISFGANMTTMTLAFTRAVGVTLKPGDRVVGTRLDHDANVSPWRIACERAGAEHVLAPFDVDTGTLDPQSVIDLIDENTKWVAVTGASNLLGTATDLATIIDAAHSAGARVYVDAVHLAPHRSIDVTALAPDALVTSPYKWYGPHAGVLYVDPELMNSLPIAKVRPAADTGPRRFESGTPNLEGIAAIDAAARFLLEEGMDRVTADEAHVFAPLLSGLQSINGVTVYGPKTLEGRVPTVGFTIAGRSTDEVSAALAADKIATWAGHSYAVEAVGQLGIDKSGGVVRAGVVRYIEDDDVQRLLTSVERLAR